MSESNRRGRSPWRTALKALGLAAGALALLVAVAFILASPLVRNSALGKRMERRFPIRWSEVALGLGGEKERMHAVATLSETRSPRALPALCRAATDRSPRVRRSAQEGILSIGRRAGDPALRALVRLCADRSSEVRAAAYATLGDLQLGFPYPRPVRRCLARGVGDQDPCCRAAAALTAAKAVVCSEPDPDLRAALTGCLLGPSPPRQRLRPEARPGYVSGVPDVVWPNQSSHPWERPGPVGPVYLVAERLVCFGGNPRVEVHDEARTWDRTNALVWLWLEGTEGSRGLVREELEKRPLG